MDFGKGTAKIEFLMHRVELKEVFQPFAFLQTHKVPNAPCGVESCQDKASLGGYRVFLMHRVELKVSILLATLSRSSVPNAPCGVESVLSGVIIRWVKISS